MLYDHTVGGDLIMAFCRELSAHGSPSQCLDMAAALEKVYSVCMTVYMCAYILCVHGWLSAPHTVL